jgi:beta-N-acetylhexosaminidase
MPPTSLELTTMRVLDRSAPAIAAALALPLLLSCAGLPRGTAAGVARPTTSAGTDPTGRAPTAAARALAARARMSLAQRVGQLIMAGVPATDPEAAASLVTTFHVGEVFLAGRSSTGVTATAAATAALRRVATSANTPTTRVGLWVATDQEGGFVQVLNGPGFSPIPTAVTQSRLSTAVLRSDSASWAHQLHQAGLDVDLAPVTDVVSGDPEDNPPIGYYRREYGRTPAEVERAVPAVVAGYAAAGVAATLKHFPGLGEVTANTDTTANVIDSVTTRSVITEAPWRAGIRAGADLVMISSARYPKIDPDHLAAFSHTVITTMLRGDLGWSGVVISDDLGDAVAVAGVAPGLRAVSFIAAGGDVVLTVNPGLVAPMVAALVSYAQRYPGFRAKVDASVLRVLTLKARMGLLPS